MQDKVKTLLIVEDQDDERKALASFLEGRHRILEAASLEEAEGHLATGAPDLIITDVRLRESDPANRDGLVLLEKVRELHKRTPVIVVTAHGSAQFIYARRGGTKVDARALGASEVVLKPLDLKALETIVESILERPFPAWTRKAFDTVSSWAPPAIVFFVFLVLWEWAVRAVGIPEYLVPRPTRIAQVAAANFSKLLWDTTITAGEVILGFVLSNVISLLIAVGFTHSRWFERSFYPYTIALKSVPIVAVAPLLVLWFGYGILGKVVMAAIVSFFPLVVNATQGLKSIDQEALDLMRSISASRRQILFKLRFPNALPHIFSALKISSALAVVGAIVAELTGAKRGIGFVILIASYNIDTPMLFAAIACASLMGILFFSAVAAAEMLILRKLGFGAVNERSHNAN